MSLINDALKRAKQVQNPSPAPHIPGPPPGGADSTASEKEGGGLFGTAGLVSVVMVALALVWLSLRGSSHEPDSVQARTPDSTALVEKPAVAAAEPAAAHVTAAPAAGAPSTQAPASAVLPPAEQLPAASSPEPQRAVALPVATPSPLKLQAIVFNPSRPSAIINGRTLFIGDRFQETRVTSITSDAATLVGGGRTNVLRLAE